MLRAKIRAQGARDHLVFCTIVRIFALLPQGSETFLEKNEEKRLQRTKDRGKLPTSPKTSPPRLAGCDVNHKPLTTNMTPTIDSIIADCTSIPADRYPEVAEAARRIRELSPNAAQSARNAALAALDDAATWAVGAYYEYDAMLAGIAHDARGLIA